METGYASDILDFSTSAGKYAPHIHRAFGNLQTWLNGIHHGVDPKYLQRYLDEFVFRYNRRETPMVTFMVFAQNRHRQLKAIGIQSFEATLVKWEGIKPQYQPLRSLLPG